MTRPFWDPLRDLAENLEPEQRRPFLKAVLERTGELATHHREPFLYAIAGLLLGELLDHLLVVPLPFTDHELELTGDHASTLGAVIGAVMGVRHAASRRAHAECVRQIVIEELRKARDS